MNVMQCVCYRNQIWRQAFLGEALHWTHVLKTHCQKLVMQIVGADKVG